MKCIGAWLIALSGLLLAAGSARADDLEFHPPQRAADAATVEIMRDLAVRVVPVYQDKDAVRFLANVSALQMAARNYTAAKETRRTLRERRRGSGAPRDAGQVILDLYAQARAAEAERRVELRKGLSQAYREQVAGLSDHEAYEVSVSLRMPVTAFEVSLQEAFDRQRSRDSIAIDDAIELIWTYLAFDAHRSIAPFAEELTAQDDAKRYQVEPAVLLHAPGGVGIRVSVVRPHSPGSVPALLEYTLDPSRDSTRECAAHGFAGVLARPERPAHGPPLVPYEQDGEFARIVLEWIAKQPWSDHRVGMYGDRYSGFTAWAAAKHRPAALAAIATSATTAPGIDSPMAGGIFQNSAYRWSLYVTNTEPGAVHRFYDDELWRSLDQQWYRSGRRYRDLGQIFGRANPVFTRWLNHPSYDAYWQRMVPWRAEFGRIDIPVLTITGYFAGSQPGALYYFMQHRRFNPHADHTLLIGPYDDAALQRGPLRQLQGYEIDAAAMVDLRELRYQWFEHVLKGAANPPLLKDRVNYQVMGSNEWRSAPDFASVAEGSRRLYLDPAPFDHEQRRLSERAAGKASVRQTVDLRDRGDAAWTAPTDFVSRSLAARNALVFVGAPFDQPRRFSGQFSGRLDFTTNRMDLDLNISLFELTPAGDYVQLYSPTYELRASYARDRTARHLLQAGVRQQLAFRSERLTSRQFQAGSRLVMLLGIAKRPDREINYGTGNDVSEESMLDADEPIRVRWYGDSYIDVPVGR